MQSSLLSCGLLGALSLGALVACGGPGDASVSESSMRQGRGGEGERHHEHEIFMPFAALRVDELGEHAGEDHNEDHDAGFSSAGGGGGSNVAPGTTNTTTVPCSTVGGDCRAPSDCGVGAGVLGDFKYECGGSRRVCCFPKCGGQAEEVECCNAKHTFAPRPICRDDHFECESGYGAVPKGTCIDSSHSKDGASHE